MYKIKKKLILLCCLVLTSLVGCSTVTSNNTIDTGNGGGKVDIVGGPALEIELDNTEESLENNTKQTILVNGKEIEWFSTEPYIILNNNIPFFTDDEKQTLKVFETYSELDSLGRCGVAYANICQELMPTEKRGAIGQIKPSGWHTVKYDCVEGKYLYNRCHLIGFQLAGENANEKNLITGTRYLNIDGMLDHENMIAEYVKDTGNHVLYRVTPTYTGANLVADGVLMEAYSIEDKGVGVQFCIYAYNAQPGVTIDYLTGESCLNGETIELNVQKQYTANENGIVYILNTSTKKYHDETCKTGLKTKEENRETFNGTIEWLEDNGYEPCGLCKPNEILVKDTVEDIGLTDEKLDDKDYVDNKIKAIFELENFEVKDFQNLFDTLEVDGYVKNVEYHEDAQIFTFEYKSGLLGGIDLEQ